MTSPDVPGESDQETFDGFTPEAHGKHEEGQPDSLDGLMAKFGEPPIEQAELPQPTKEDSLLGSVWRLSQETIVNFARAQAAFILAQNDFIKTKDTSAVASAQHVFIEAQAEVLAKFGVVS